MDTLLDPLTGEYQTNETTNSLHNAVYIRLLTPYGSWWGDPSLGSRLHLLKREKNTVRVRRLAVQYAEQALQPLIDDNRAKKIEVTELAENKQRGWLFLHIIVHDAGNDKIYFKHQVRVL